MCTKVRSNSSKAAAEGVKEGSITVFLALSLTLLAAIFLSTVEAARTQGARTYFTLICNSGIDSLFSQYHLKLWEDYRLLGLEHYSDEQLCEEFKDFTAPYMTADNFYPLKQLSAEVAEKTLITDLEGEIFEDQVLDYMKYGIMVSVMDGSAMEALLDTVTDGASLFGLQESYMEHSVSAVRLEESLEAIDESLGYQDELFDSAYKAARRYDGSDFRKRLSDLRNELERIPKMVSDYRDAADKLGKELSNTKQRYDDEIRNGKLKESTAKSLLSEMEKYSSYVDEDGKRRLEVEKLPAEAEENIQLIDDMIAESEYIDDYISSYVYEDEFDPGPDLYSLWAPVRSMMASYNGLDLGLNKGIEDKEKESKLESISRLLDGDILDLLVPDGMMPKSDKLDLTEAPSSDCFSGYDHCRRNIPDRIYISEYMIQHLNYYGRGSFGDGEKAKGSGALELEYVLYGKESDRDNLYSAVMELLTLRSGLNLVHIFSDSEKRSQAHQLALAITGALGFTPIVGVMSFFIMSVWALGQAFADVKKLLSGGKVRLMHTRDTFELSLEGLLDMAGGTISESSDKDESGLCYRDYLRLFLVQRQGTKQDYRCMDMIQMALRKDQKDYLMKSCAGELTLRSTVNTGHIFTEALSFLGHETESSRYTMSAETSFAY